MKYEEMRKKLYDLTIDYRHMMAEVAPAMEVSLHDYYDFINMSGDATAEELRKLINLLDKFIEEKKQVMEVHKMTCETCKDTFKWE